MYRIQIVRPGIGAEDFTCESWGDVIDAIDGMDFYLKNGTVSDFTVWIED